MRVIKLDYCSELVRLKNVRVLDRTAPHRMETCQLWICPIQPMEPLPKGFAKGALAGFSIYRFILTLGTLTFCSPTIDNGDQNGIHHQ
jgi:hypothetical protein